MIELVECVDANGVSPFGRWRDRLDTDTSARVILAAFRLASGNYSLAKGVGGGVFELRLNFGPGYRVYFGRDGEELVLLLGGGTKKRQREDIEAAQRLWRYYKQTKIKRS